MTGIRVPFYNRAPWNLVLGTAFFVAPIVAVASYTSPFVLLVPFFVWIFLYAKRSAHRARCLRSRAYYSGARYRDYWVYEERHGYSDVALILPVANTEPGRWELFIPNDDTWRTTVPDWARDRRAEIVARIAESWKPDRIHL